MSAAQVVCNSIVNRCGMVVRVVLYAGKLWAVANDVAACLGLGKGSFTARINIHSDAFHGHVEKIQVWPASAPCWIVSEDACRLFVSGLKTKKTDLTEDFLAWLEEGGMQLKSADVCASELSVPAELSIPKAPVLALVPSTPPKVPSARNERTKAYCRELLKTLLRYADEDDTEHLMQVVEGEVAGLISHRYCQGLNDARYELYRRFWLQGGAK
ncbi:TPA: hypothetical protein ACKRPO_005755 [Pseudomonas aeruginosa]|nr:hypothetical protein [Pseudomonas aeruginosa]